MPTLRDMFSTYEVCLAADVRRPRLAFERFDPRWLASLARTLCRDDASLRVIRQLVHDAVGLPTADVDLPERFADLVACGRLVLRELATSDAYPLPDPYAELPVPLADLWVPEPPGDEAPLRTWISLELVHAAGWSTEAVELELTTGSGRELHGRLDARGRWRSDAIDGRTCSVRLLDHPVLHSRRPIRTGGRRAGRGTERTLEDVLWPVDSGRQLDLRSAEHHRIVIVQPSPPYHPSL